MQYPQVKEWLGKYKTHETTDMDKTLHTDTSPGFRLNAREIDRIEDWTESYNDEILLFYISQSLGDPEWLWMPFSLDSESSFFTELGVSD